MPNVDTSRCARHENKELTSELRDETEIHTGLTQSELLKKQTYLVGAMISNEKTGLKPITTDPLGQPPPEKPPNNKNKSDSSFQNENTTIIITKIDHPERLNNTQTLYKVQTNHWLKIIKIITIIYPTAFDAFLIQKGGIVVKFNTQSEAEKAFGQEEKQKLRDNLGKNAEIRKGSKRTYRVVLTKVPRHFDEDFIHQSLNKNLKGYVSHKTLGHKENKKRFKAVSIELTSETIRKKTLIDGVVRIGFNKCRVELPTPKKTIQCKKCGKFGHSETICGKKSFTCLRCSGQHPTEACAASRTKCINCEGAHESTSNSCNKWKTLQLQAREALKRRLYSTRNCFEAHVKREVSKQNKWIEKEIRKRASSVVSKLGEVCLILNKNKSKISKTNLKILSINARSLNKNGDEIKQYISEENPDVVCIQETWLTPRHNKFNIRQYKSIFTEPSVQKGCGVGILIKDHIKCQVLKVHNINEKIEYISIRIMTRQGNWTIHNVYIHPAANEEGINIIEDLLSESNERTICIGDVNAHHPKWSLGNGNKRGTQLFGIIQANRYEVLGDKNYPTRYNPSTGKSGSPDLAIVDKKNVGNIKEWKTGRDVGSDHLPIIVTLTTQPHKRTIHKRNNWTYSKCKVDEYEKHIVEGMKLWDEEIKEIDNIDTIYNKFQNTIIAAAEKACPKSKEKQWRKGNPWWNQKCKIEVKNRTRKRRTLQRRRNLLAYKLYKIQDIRTKKTITEAKSNYWDKTCSNLSVNDAYKIYKNLNNSKQKIVAVTTPGKGNITNQEEIAQSLCNYFATCNDKASQRGKKDQQRGKEKQRRTLIRDPNYNNPITTEEVKEVVRKLNIKKANGPDEIHPFMIKLASEQLLPYLTKIFNLSFIQGETPKIWREGRLFPIPKINNSIIPIDKFRPIALLSVIGKMLEKIICKRITEVAERKKWLPTFQNGFRWNKSTINNLIVLQQEIHEAYKNKEYMITVFIDISKA
jgi:endonuclease/exonuclease/phosphatase (EEP) superfamily protein YafD